MKIKAILVFLVMSAIGVHAQQSGSISGQVTFVGDLPPLKPIKVSGNDREHCGELERPNQRLSLGQNKEIANVVVWLEDLPAEPPVKNVKATLDNRKCMFEPHIQVIQRGTELAVKNSDDINHSTQIFWEWDKSEAGPNTVTFTGQQAEFEALSGARFKKPVFCRVGCAYHPWMDAGIIVMPHPYYALTGADGKFTITKLTPGNHTLKAWHELLGFAEKTIRIEADKGLQLDLSSADFKRPE